MIKKLIITSSRESFNYILSNSDCKINTEKTHFTIYDAFLKFDESWEEALICHYSWDNIELFELLTYVFENYTVVKIISIDTAINLNEFNASSWDVFMPNTFVSNEELPPLFIEEVADNNYDLWDFWVLMNWFCYSSISEINEEIIEKVKENSCDIIDRNAYAIVTKADIQGLKDKTIIIRWIDTENEIIHRNMFEVLELIY